LAASGLLGGLAHIAMTEALARAPVSTLAPFEYTALPLALVFDVMMSGVAPSGFGLTGAALIVAAAAAVALGDVTAGRAKAKTRENG
jgi:drug/metabolite transporter (DMT)-like permease